MRVKLSLSVVLICALTGSLWANNLVVNGDFSNGAEGWTITVPDAQAAACTWMTLPRRVRPRA